MRDKFASVLVPAPSVPSVCAWLAEIRWRMTVEAVNSVPKSVVTFARDQLLVPVSAINVVPFRVDGPAVKAIAPVIAPVPMALDAPPRKTSTLVMSSGSNGMLNKWWSVCGALQRMPSTQRAVWLKVPPRRLTSDWMPKGPRERTSTPGTVSRTSESDDAAV